MTHPNEDLAAALRHISDLLIERDMSDNDRETAQRLAASLVETLEAGEPVDIDVRTRRFDRQMSIYGRSTEIADGAVFDSFSESPCSGSSNALAPRQVIYRRHGQTVVASVVLGTALQGRPGRAHGGAVAAVFDDAMGALQRVIRRNGFTQSLTTKYHAAFPTNDEVSILVECTDVSAPHFTVEATASFNDRIVASATGLFVEIDITRL